MPVKSEVHRGLIYAGATALASTIRAELVGPLTLVIRSGALTTTGDLAAGVAPATFILANDVVVPIVPDPAREKRYRVDLVVGRDGSVDVAVRGHYLGDPMPPLPDGWRVVHALVFEFVVPPRLSDLAPVDIYVLTVVPGLPEGTIATDWRIQTGSRR